MPSQNTDLDRRIRRLLSTASHGRIGIRSFESLFPNIAQQIRLDSESNVFDYWGQSRNIDEHENKLIVDPKILSVIGRIANFPIRDGKSYHAGLILTYGYLLSNLKTRYGYKRERWTTGVIESGFGIQSGLFSHAPPDGTLLSNITFLLSGIAFAKRKSDRNALSAHIDSAEELKGFPFSNIKLTRIKESITLPRNKQVDLLTDLVRFKHPTKAADSLVVYSFQSNHQQRLVTCFPIGKMAVDNLLRESRLPNKEVRPRYNLFLKNY